MSKLMRVVLPSALLALAAPGVAPTAPLGPDAAVCRAGTQPAMLVRVTGLRSRTGSLRVQAYGGDPARFFDKGSYIARIDLPVPAAGAADVCVKLPRPGTYAVSVRHDQNTNGRNDMKDGGGLSGNPELSLFDVVLHRKPDPAVVSVHVGTGTRLVPVTMNYLQGGAFRPVDGSEGRR